MRYVQDNLDNWQVLDTVQLTEEQNLFYDKVLQGVVENVLSSHDLEDR